MIKNITIIGLIVLTLIGCKGSDRPDDVIEPEHMSAILLDVYLSETEFADLKMHRDTTLMLFDMYEEHIFQRHEVTEEQYRESLTYYYDHPDELDMVYETVMDSLTLRETKLKALEEADREKKKQSSEARRDSLKSNVKSTLAEPK